MRSYRKFLAIFIATLLLSVNFSNVFGQGRPAAIPVQQPIPTNQWAVQVTPGSDVSAVAQFAGLVNRGQIPNLPGYYLFEAPGLNLANSAAVNNLHRGLRNAPGVTFAQQQFLVQRELRVPTDPLYGNQWHLNNTGQGGGTAGEDANVVAAWNAGYTGAGVVMGIIDDGPAYDHPDIADNWRGADSYDYYSNDADPYPTLSGEAHGTSVAGVAAGSDNAVCGVGASYDADIVGIRLIVGNTTDAQEASSLGHKTDVVDIYNNSWGPSDNGAAWGGAGPLALQAIENGALNGRGGLGTIYVWAGGNGHSNDNAGADSFVNSRYTIGVAATTNTGVQSYYSERGSSILINAPSNGGSAGITTTDRPGIPGYTTGDCTGSFGGTSSASPLAAGVVGLILEANPNLTWRDVQAILLQSAEKNDPANGDWTTNGAGYNINHAYGFGRVDAGAAVALAGTWTNLDTEYNFSSGVITENAPIPDTGYGEFTFEVSEVMTVESVEVVLNATHTWRGDIQVELLSPMGTNSIMLYSRPNDSGADGGDNITDYTLLSMRNWGEEALGTWTLRVTDTFPEEDYGTLIDWELKINGTQSLDRDAELVATDQINVGDSTTVTLSDLDLAGNGSTVISATSDNGESESLTLTETGALGVFEGIFNVANVTPTASNDTLEGVPGDTFTFTYNDAVNSTGNPVNRTATTEILATDATIIANQTAPQGGATTVIVTDVDQSGTGILSISATSDAGESETFTLSETGTPGTFETTLSIIDIAPITGNDTLEGLVGDTFTFTYNDAYNTGESAVNRTATTLIVPVTYELLANGSFEIYDTGTKQPTGWTPRNAAKMKVKCNKDKDGDGIVDKIFAYDGECAYFIKGKGVDQKLVQTVSGTDVEGIAVGDMLQFSIQLDVRNVTNSVAALLKVKYTETDPITGKPLKDKVKVKVANGQHSGGYFAPTFDPIITGYDILNIKAMLRYRGTSGKIFYDLASVIHTPQSAILTPAIAPEVAPEAVSEKDAIPLPPAPDGFNQAD